MPEHHDDTDDLHRQLPPQCSSTPSTGTCRFRCAKHILDEYTFNKEEDVIGSGAFSVVYRAVPISVTAIAASSHVRMITPQRATNAVALKVISRSSISDSESRQQRREVEREVSVLQKLAHTGCTLVVEALQTPEEYCIAMHLLDGCMDAGRYLKAFGPLSEEHAAIVVLQLLQTAQYLHRSFGLLHRDIKVENLILSPPPPPPPPSQPLSSSAVGALHAPATPPTPPLDPQQPVEHLKASCDGTADGGHETNNKMAKSSSVQPFPLDTTADNSAAMKNIRRYGRVTLVDFGLARWLPQVSAGGGDAFSGGTPPGGVSPVSPHPRGGAFDVFPSDVSPPLGCLPIVAAAGGAALNEGGGTIHVSCCGSDKYMAPELLKWYVEHHASSSRQLVAPQAAPQLPSLPSQPQQQHNGHSRKVVPVAHAMKMDVYSIGVVAYALLSGCLPFSGKTRAAIAQQQATVSLKMNSQHWQGISADAKRFVAKLLHTDVLARCSVEDALQDSWLSCRAALCVKLRIVPEQLPALPAKGFACPRQKDLGQDPSSAAPLSSSRSNASATVPTEEGLENPSLSSRPSSRGSAVAEGCPSVNNNGTPGLLQSKTKAGDLACMPRAQTPSSNKCVENLRDESTDTKSFSKSSLA